jgi:hypothetical protein
MATCLQRCSFEAFVKLSRFSHLAVLLACGALLLAPNPWRLLTVVPAVFLFLLFYFFRDPKRDVPDGTNLIVAPADGTVTKVELDTRTYRSTATLSIVDGHRVPQGTRAEDTDEQADDHPHRQSERDLEPGHALRRRVAARWWVSGTSA